MRIGRRPSVADSVVKALENRGVDVVFGVPGTHNIDLYDALRRSRIRSVLTTSEIAAGFMAAGWYRASGQPGVFAVMEGPGFAWSVTTLAEAAQDSSAIIALTGKTPEASQPYDQANIGQDQIAGALGAASFEVPDSANADAVVAAAWREVSSIQPGPAVLFMAHDGANESAEPAQELSAGKTNDPAADQTYAAALSALESSEKPLILAGADCLDHAVLLSKLVSDAGIPCITTPMARGVVAESHPLCLTTDLFFDDIEAINTVADQADLVLALGCRFSRSGTAGYRLRLPQEKLIHVTPFAPNVSQYTPRLTVRASIGAFLDSAIFQSRPSGNPADAGWDVAQLSEARRVLRSRPRRQANEPSWAEQGDSSTLFRRIQDGTSPDTIVVTDTGLHQMLVRSHLNVEQPRGLLFPSDFQSMGFGLPAAIGAALAAPDRKVLAIIGDGSFLMVGAEFITAKREKLGLPVLVFCDNSLGIIRHQQIHRFGHGESTQLAENDLASYSKWLGIEYALADETLSDQIRAAFDRAVPTLIEVCLEDSDDFKKSRRKSLIKSTIKSAIGS